MHCATSVRWLRVVQRRQSSGGTSSRDDASSWHDHVRMRGKAAARASCRRGPPIDLPHAKLCVAYVEKPLRSARRRSWRDFSFLWKHDLLATRRQEGQRQRERQPGSMPRLPLAAFWGWLATRANRVALRLRHAVVENRHHNALDRPVVGLAGVERDARQ